MEEGFAHVGQRFDDLKENFSHRFDGLERRMDQLHADMLQMRNWLVRLYGLVVFGFIGAITLILFRDLFFK
jgi:tetrahydromethanopterin S-methyltransferase subunit G